MKNQIIQLFLVVLLASCGEETSIIGEQFFEEGTFAVTYVDSISVSLSTIRFDSLPTSFEERMLIGSHVDERLGYIQSIPYFQIGIDETSSYALSSDDFEFDSLTLAIEFDGYQYYETDLPLNFSVHRVTDDIELNEAFLYNTSVFHFDSTDIYGSGVIRPSRIRSEYVMEIKLKQSFGQELMDRLIHEPEEFRLNAPVVDYLKGFVLICDRISDGGFYGITKNTSLNLYYHNADVIPNQQQIFGFPISSNIYFNGYLHDRTGKQIADLEVLEDDLSSEHNNHEAYISSGIGLGLKVTLPYLENLTFVTEEFIISKALLKIKPVSKTFEQDDTPLLPELFTYEIDDHNEIIQLLPEKSVLVQDTDYDKNTFYELDITSFVLDELKSRQFGERGLLVIPNNDSFYASMDRIIVGDMFHESSSELIIYIVINK